MNKYNVKAVIDIVKSEKQAEEVKEFFFGSEWSDIIIQKR